MKRTLADLADWVHRFQLFGFDRAAIQSYLGWRTRHPFDSFTGCFCGGESHARRIIH